MTTTAKRGAVSRASRCEGCGALVPNTWTPPGDAMTDETGRVFCNAVCLQAWGDAGDTEVVARDEEPVVKFGRTQRELDAMYRPGGSDGPVFAMLAKRWCYTSQCMWWRLEYVEGCLALEGLPLSKGDRGDALDVLRVMNDIRQRDGLPIVYVRGL